jgi:hypothetical protein
MAIPIQDNQWAGQPAFIVGGGPSLRGFDHRVLRGRNVIGLNWGFLARPSVTLVMDKRNLNKIVDSDHYRNYEGVTIWASAYADCEFGVGPNGVVAVKRAERWSKSLLDGIYPGSFDGHNAGLAGLNLAEILGADPIYLLGYDMKGEAGKTANWHDKYPADWKHGEDCYTRYARDIAECYPAMKSRVINLNRDSGLKCFEFGDLQEIIP